MAVRKTRSSLRSLTDAFERWLLTRFVNPDHSACRAIIVVAIHCSDTALISLKRRMVTVRGSLRFSFFACQITVKLKFTCHFLLRTCERLRYTCGSAQLSLRGCRFKLIIDSIQCWEAHCTHIIRISSDCSCRNRQNGQNQSDHQRK